MKIETERDVVELLTAARALAVASAWNSLGLFELLRKGPILRHELPGDRRALEVTIPVLAHVGVVATDGERISLTPAGERLLADRAMPTEQNLVFLGDLSRMADVMREGGPVRDAQGNRKGTRGGTVPDNPERTAVFLDMLHRLAEPTARSTFAWLAPGLPEKAAVLDLGGGHGRYARAFADAGHDVTLFDQPMVVELAKKRHGDHLAYVAGDFHAVDGFGGPYDLVLLCNIVHGESKEANVSLLTRAARSLKPGGRIAIRDMFLGEHGHDPASAVFFGMTMLFYTESGTSPTVREVEAWLAKAGLGDFRLVADGPHQILLATKR